eukprot:1707815-Pleurochrysis_carterae.AAC.2
MEEVRIVEAGAARKATALSASGMEVLHNAATFTCRGSPLSEPSRNEPGTIQGQSRESRNIFRISQRFRSSQTHARAHALE